MANRDEKEKVLLDEIDSLRQKVEEIERCEVDRKRAEETFLDLFNATEEVALLMDREGIVLVANKNTARLYGIPVERLPGKSIYDLIPADRVESSKEKIKTVVKTRATLRFEGKLGEKVFENSLYPVLEDGKEVQRIALYVRDITEKKRLQAILKQTEERYRDIYENAMEGIFQIGPDGHFISANPSLARIHGYDSPGEMIRSVRDIRSAYVNPDDHTRLVNLLFEQGAVQNHVAQMHRKDGSLQWISVNVRLVRNAQGEALYYEGTMMDITERKLAEEALVKSHQELEQLNRAKTKAVNLISHELRTPLSVIQGNIRLLKRRLKRLSVDSSFQNIVETLERNLARLSGISKETDEIFRISQELEAGVLLDNLDKLWQRVEDLSDMPSDVRSHFNALKAWLGQYLSGSIESFQSINLFPFVLDVLERVKQLSSRRNIRFLVEGKNDLFVFIDPFILQNIVEGLLRNAVENTPDGGKIRLGVEEKHGKIALHITDYGVGITEENQAYIFDGLFHTKETELYASKKPYDFGAGGKGLDLLRMKIYGQRFGFGLSMTSRRCVYIPTDQDQCPGDISRCPHVEKAEECAASGGTTFTIAFPAKQASQPAHI